MQLEHKQKVKLQGKGLKVGIAVARFNETINTGLLASARRALVACGVRDGDVTIVSVAGAVEIPYALQRLAKTKKYDCLVALGSVIRGETAHFDYVCKMVQEGILRVTLDNSIPVGFGIMTTNNLKQAQVRLHFGEDAALAAVELALMKFVPQ